MSAEISYAWQRVLREATEEDQPNQVATRTRLAEVAIFERIGSFSRLDHGEEEQALFEALFILRTLKTQQKSDEPELSP
jgi:hypothetical protein